MPRSRASWVLLESDVHLDVEDESGWAIMFRGRSMAIGCGDDDYFGEVLEGLTLMARLADPPAASSLCICSTFAKLEYAKVLIAEKDIIIMTICVNRSDAPSGSDAFRTRRRVCYYLIYDACDASLAMTPHVHVSNPGYRGWETVPLPLPFRRPDGRISLVHIATSRTDMWKKFSCPDVLFLWPPSPCQSSSKPSSSRAAPWDIKVPNYPKEIPVPRAIGFSIQQTFSFKGMAFWADLARGILYCKHSDLSSQPKSVQFHFIKLPPGCRCSPHLMHDVSTTEFRTMGCVGDTIKFVSISGHLGGTYKQEAIADLKVTIWTLMPDLSTWKEDRDHLCIKDLWKQDTFKKAGLSVSVRPKLPVLSPHEDCVLYLVLPDYYVGNDGFICCRERHILRVDMREKLLFSSRVLPSSDHVFRIRILGTDFFQHHGSHLLSPLAIRDKVTHVLKKPSASEKEPGSHGNDLADPGV